MIEDLTSFGITPNEIDSDVGENGEENEDEDGSHGMIDRKADYLGPKNLSPLK